MLLAFPFNRQIVALGTPYCLSVAYVDLTSFFLTASTASSISASEALSMSALRG